MKNLLRSTVMALLVSVASMAFGAGAVPPISVTVSDAGGKAAFKGNTNSAGAFSTAKLQPGNYTVHVGTSSADTPLEQTVALAGDRGAVPPPPTPTPTDCLTVQPGPDWVCVNGGWLPPGHPGTGLLNPPAPSPAPPSPSPGPPSPTPAACQTVQPGPDWVCVNGGWLPPGHPAIGNSTRDE